MKHYSKKLNVFLYTCLALFAYSCSEENDFIKKNRVDFTVKEKSFKAALDMPVFTNAYSKLAKKTVASTNTDLARTALEEQFGFMIVPDSPVKIITKEDGTVYFTILIERNEKEDLRFENLIMKVFNEETSAAIFKYKLTEKGIISQTGDYAIKGIESTVFTDLNVEGKMFFNSGGETCFDISVILCDVADHRAAGHIATSDCWDFFNTNENATNIYLGTSVVCMNPDGGGSESENGNNPGGTSSNNNGGLGANTNSENEVITSLISCKTGNCIEADSVKTPCESLNDLFLPLKGNIRSTLTEVNTSAIGVNGEKGAYFTKIGTTYNNHMINQSSGNSIGKKINIPVGLTIYGAVHSHPVYFDGAPMFSFSDLVTLFTLYRKTSEENKQDVVFMLLLPNGSIFAIKINDFSAFRSYLNSYDSILSVQNVSDKEKEKNLVFDNKTRKGSQVGDSEIEDKYVRGFLDEMKNHGVDLYRMTSTTNPITSDIKYGWEKLKPPVNPSDVIIQELPCNPL